MKVTGWTWWDDDTYEEMFPIEKRAETWDKIAEVERLIAKELRDHGYKFTGSYHQEGDSGTPIIDNTWRYCCSCRSWGDIMRMAYPDEIDNSDGYGYVEWAWMPPKEMIVPSIEEIKED